MRKIITVLFTIFVCSSVFAVNEDTEKIERDLMFFQVQSGYAWLGKADISGATEANNWDSSNEGYNAQLSDASFLDFAIGFYPFSFLDVGVSYGFYETMHYEKYQTGTSETEGFTGSHRIRYLDVDHKNVMVNLTFHPPKNMFSIDTSLVSVFPFIGGGFGIGINRVNNFHTVGYSNEVGSTTTIGSRYNNNSFAWQANAGLTFAACNHKLAFDLGYRYLDGGTFKSASKFMLNTSTYEGAYFSTHGWSGKIKAHEAVVAFRYSF
jgi:hypothetical protein